MNIVSLLPSVTEIVCSLGLRNALVGRSHECDFPEDVLSLPAVTKTSYPEQRSGRETDQTVREIVSSGLSPFEADPDLLRRLEPDIIITQDHCEVCAISIDRLKAETKSYLENADVDLLSVSPSSLQEIMDSITDIGHVLNVPDRAANLVTELSERLNIIRQTVQGEPEKSAVTLEWISPLMTAGNWVPELIEIAGGDDLIGIPGDHSPWIDFDAVRESDPDYLLIMPCGYSIQDTMNEFEALERTDGWVDLKAVREQQVYLLDGSQFFNRPGPRIYDSARILAEIFHPNLFQPLYKGTGWIPAGHSVAVP
ncbi:cobalamin-binding protein [Rhodohalobacter mucosus]|uniref:Cobalamin-binding protein n=1 Tax=Rhodohalobacter mucosus TaxID=2079485 RepID=A0A316TS66_9BACT|nr:cobalamin-binding protein [Rhodohalobacter mucosus]PWN07230.1 cobalamin-binding protein [Rhodohalobacter mucosus]